MVTLYLAGTSIRLESKLPVGEHVLQKYREFKERTPKEFCILKTGKGYFAYLKQYCAGKDVAEQATKLDDENGKIIERLSTLEKQDEQEPVEQSADDLPEFESYLCLMLQKFRTKGMCTNGEIIDYVNEHSQKLRDILVKQQRLTDEQLKSLQEIIDRERQLYK